MTASAQAHNDDGNPSDTGPQKFRTRNLVNIMAVTITGEFEATLTLRIGMRRQTWVKVSTLSALRSAW